MMWIACMQCEWTATSFGAQHVCPNDPVTLKAKLLSATAERDDAIREHGMESGFWGRMAARATTRATAATSALTVARVALDDAEVALCAHSQPMVPRVVIEQWLLPIRAALAAPCAEGEKK